MVVDFEGQPGRPLADRRIPGTPLRDLACFLLSLDHVAVAAARRLSFGPALDAALVWSAEARAAADRGLSIRGHGLRSRRRRAASPCPRGREGVPRGDLRFDRAARVVVRAGARAAATRRRLGRGGGVNPEKFLADVLSAPERLETVLDAYGGTDSPLAALPVDGVERCPLPRDGQLPVRRAHCGFASPRPRDRRVRGARLDRDADATPGGHPRRRHLRLGRHRGDRRGACTPSRRQPDGGRHEQARVADRGRGGRDAPAPRGAGGGRGRVRELPGDSRSAAAPLRAADRSAWRGCTAACGCGGGRASRDA